MEVDLVIAGKESLDYNGGMVPGMIAAILGYNFRKRLCWS